LVEPETTIAGRDFTSKGSPTESRSGDWGAAVAPVVGGEAGCAGVAGAGVEGGGADVCAAACVGMAMEAAKARAAKIRPEFGNMRFAPPLLRLYIASAANMAELRLSTQSGKS